MPLDDLDDTLPLNVIKSIFSCPMLDGKPKLLLLNGWKEATINNDQDFLTLCSSFDNVSPFQFPLPSSLFPFTLSEIILENKSEPIENLIAVVSKELKNTSKNIIQQNGENIDINESFTIETTLKLQLQFCFVET